MTEIMCAYCGGIHESTELCKQAPQWTRRGFVSFIAAATGALMTGNVIPGTFTDGKFMRSLGLTVGNLVKGDSVGVFWASHIGGVIQGAEPIFLGKAEGSILNIAKKMYAPEELGTVIVRVRNSRAYEPILPFQVEVAVGTEKDRTLIEPIRVLDHIINEPPHKPCKWTEPRAPHKP